MLPVITVKEGKERKERKEGKKDTTECYFFFFSMYVCRGGGKKCVCVLSGIEDNNTKKIFSPNLFLVCAKFVSQRVF